MHVHGYSFIWNAGQDLCFPGPNGDKIAMHVVNYVPYIGPPTADTSAYPAAAPKAPSVPLDDDGATKLLVE